MIQLSCTTAFMLMFHIIIFRTKAMGSIRVMARLTSMAILSLRRRLEIGKPVLLFWVLFLLFFSLHTALLYRNHNPIIFFLCLPHDIQVLNVVNVWLIMGSRLILLLILPISCMKEMCLLLEMLPPGQALAILHPSLELCWQMLIGEDIGQ